jgi:hypothetical protein
VEGEKAVKFSKCGFDDLRDCRAIKIIWSGVVRDIPRDIQDALDIGWLA